jgi:hypothetical protein
MSQLVAGLADRIDHCPAEFLDHLRGVVAGEKLNQGLARRNIGEALSS